MNETRRDPREPIELKLRYKSASVDEFAERESGDLSLGGIFIKSEEPLEIGTLLKFEVQLADETSIIAGVGRVVWNRGEEASSESAPTGMGIKFVKMDEASRTLLEELIERRGAEAGAFDEVAAAATAESAENAESADTDEAAEAAEQPEPGDDDVTVKLSAQPRDEEAAAEPPEASGGFGRMLAIAGLVALIAAGAYWALGRDAGPSEAQIDTAEKSE